MKFGTITTIVMNTGGMLIGVALYYMMVGDYLLSLFCGLTAGILGNVYGMWLRANMKDIIWGFINELMKPSEKEEKEVLNIISSIKK